MKKLSFNLFSQKGKTLLEALSELDKENQGSLLEHQFEYLLIQNGILNILRYRGRLGSLSV